MTANDVVSWIEYVASLAALYVYPTPIAVVRHVENIKLVPDLELHPGRLASRATPRLHDAT